MPKVSVIIPAYNCARYIADAIESVRAQSFTDREIIVVDDGSTDDTRGVLARCAAQVRYIYQENRGPAAARNTGIRSSFGEFVAFLDADDLWLDGYLDKCMSLMAAGGHDLVMTDNYFHVYDEEGTLVRKEYRSRENYAGNEDRLYEALFNRFYGGFWGEIRIVIRRSALDAVGLFDEGLTNSEDWDMWLRFARARLAVGYIREPLFVYRRFPTSLCRNKSFRRSNLESIYNAYKKNRREAFAVNGSLKKTYERVLWNTGWEAVKECRAYVFGVRCIAESQWYGSGLGPFMDKARAYFGRRLFPERAG